METVGKNVRKKGILTILTISFILILLFLQQILNERVHNSTIVTKQAIKALEIVTFNKLS